MELFNLPFTTKVNKVIPKNAFDSYTNPKQKKQFSELVSRITWLAKISKETVNLEPKEIIEIQLFKVEIKQKTDIKQLLELIDKSIPYNIVFIVEYDVEFYLSTSTKHPHPLNPDNAIIDWTFRSEWLSLDSNTFSFDLKKNLDFVYQDICNQLTERKNNFQDLNSLVKFESQVSNLKKEIDLLRTSISKTTQFNKKVELNLKLKESESKLKSLLS